MLDLINPVAAESADDITLADLMVAAEAQPDLPLLFHYDGRAVKPGYHVTEVKMGRFSALDCGANPEAWSEIFIQLWDVDESARSHMPSGKFARIIRKVSDHVALDGAVRMTFEVSDGITPIQLHRAGAPRLADGAMHVQLSPRPASCKPRDRWLRASGASTVESCCG